MVDMHIHSNFSDGSDTVQEICQHTKNYDLFSITDHNNIMSSKIIDVGNYITGVELSIKASELDTSSNGELHLLAYDYNSSDKKLNEMIDEFNYYNNLTYLKIFTNIVIKNRLKVDLEKFKNLTDKSITLNKVYLAKILMESGYGNDLYEIFHKYIKESLYSEPQYYYFKCKEIVDAVKNSGAYLLLAHPYSYGLDNKLDELIKKLYELGIDGLEMDNNHYNQIMDYIKKYNFMYSVGSDYHSKNYNKCNVLGIDDTLYQNDERYLKSILLSKKTLRY